MSSTVTQGPALRTNLRDLEFCLFESQGGTLGDGDGIERDTAEELLRGVHALASGVFAAANAPGDREGATLVDGKVTVPALTRRAIDAYFDGDWHLLDVPLSLGGLGAPPSLRFACGELLLAANPAAAIACAGGPLFAGLIDPVVTPEQRERWLLPWVRRRWAATMVLTEPDAGSDVGAARTTATRNDDGTWNLSGTKRFIT